MIRLGRPADIVLMLVQVVLATVFFILLVPLAILLDLVYLTCVLRDRYRAKKEEKQGAR